MARPSEEWRQAPGFLSLYVVSSAGRVRAIVPPRGNGLLFGEIDKGGYRRVNLTKDGKKVKRGVHRLVCEAFHGPQPDGHEVGHLDGNPRNNAASNLAWVTRSENVKHQVLHGTHNTAGKRSADHHRAKLSDQDVEQIRASDEGHRPLARKLGVNESAVRKIRKGVAWA